MNEGQIRKEQTLAANEKYEKFKTRMRTVLSNVSQTNEGCMLLRFLMHECCFTSPLTHETIEGVNRDVLIGNEAKRRLYLSLRAYMDRGTILRVEVPDDLKGVDDAGTK